MYVTTALMLALQHGKKDMTQCSCAAMQPCSYAAITAAAAAHPYSYKFAIQLQVCNSNNDSTALQ